MNRGDDGLLKEKLRWLVGADSNMLALTATSFGVKTETLAAIVSVRAIAAVLAHHESRLWQAANLTPAQGWLLTKLYVAGPARQADLAEDLLVTQSAISQLSNRLEGDGLISRQRSPDDRRESILDLTTEGRAVIRKLLPTIHATLTSVQARLNEAGIEQLISQLQKLRAGIEDGATLIAGEAPDPPT